MLSFRKLYKIISENNTASECFGSATKSNWSADGTNIDYAKNDNRVPKILGTKNKKNKKIKFKIIRRPKI